MLAQDAGWMSTREAAERLGVKRETIYAYVSRGRLTSRRAADGRKSEVLAADVRRLSEGRPRDGGASDTTSRSDVSDCADGRLTYRGYDVAELVASSSFGAVAELLWMGCLPDVPIEQWSPNEDVGLAVAAIVGHLPADTLPLEVLQITVPVAAALDGFRHDLDRTVVRVTGRNLISTMVAALPRKAPAEGAPTGHGKPIAANLWSRLGSAPPTEDRVAALDAAMILMADHGFARSTVAARVAASAYCDPYGVVMAGLATASGALHGGASLAVEDILFSLEAGTNPSRQIGQRLRRGDHLIGFGHHRYPDGDPRARILLDLIRDRLGHLDEVEVVDRVVTQLASRGLPAPNIDFALAALSFVTGMDRGAGEVIFVIARTAGWLAHALEEFEQGRAEY